MKYKKLKKLLLNNLIICGSFLLAYNINSYASNENIDLTHKSIVKSFGGNNSEEFYSVVETYDEGLVAVGYSLSTNADFINNGEDEAILIKYDKDGNQQWIKNFGASGNECFYSVTETYDNGLVAVGSSNSTDAGFTNKGYKDAVIVKYDKNGNQQWVKSFGGSGTDSFESILETYDGGLVVVGSSSSTNSGFTNNGGNDAIIVKYDKDGNQQWVKTLEGLILIVSTQS